MADFSLDSFFAPASSIGRYSVGGVPYDVPGWSGNGGAFSSAAAGAGGAASAAPGAPAWAPAAAIAGGGLIGGIRAGGTPFTSGFNGSNFLSGAGTGALSAGFGLAGAAVGGQTNTGGQIGRTLGSTLGYVAPPLAMFGSFAGQAIGEQFGPPPTVGPTGHVNYMVGPDGMLYPYNSGGDNGFDATSRFNAASGPAQNFNFLMQRYGGKLKPTDPVNHAFGVGFGNNESDPAIRLGDWMGPVIDDNSFARALIQQGYVTGVDEQTRAAMLRDLGGPDPHQVYGYGRWAQPEAVPEGVRPYLTTLPSGVETVGGGLDPVQMLQLSYGIDPWAWNNGANVWVGGGGGGSDPTGPNGGNAVATPGDAQGNAAP